MGANGIMKMTTLVLYHNDKTLYKDGNTCDAVTGIYYIVAALLIINAGTTCGGNSPLAQQD